MLLGATAWTNAGMGVFTGADKHFNAMLSVSILVVIITCGAAMYAAGGEEHAADRAGDSAGAGAESAGADGVECELEEQLLPREGEDGMAGDRAETPSALAATRTTTPDDSSIGQGEKMLCVIQAMGWIGICSQSFFWTVSIARGVAAWHRSLAMLHHECSCFPSSPVRVPSHEHIHYTTL